jgi:predicted acetyltransferase
MFAPVTEVSIDAATEREELVLQRMFQLYAHDFSEHKRLELGEDGLFSIPDLSPYFHDPLRHAYLVRKGDRLAGFALVQERSYLTGKEGTTDLAEFFVLRGYRRAGVGRSAAHALFARFRTDWEVRQLSTNVDATAFWRRAIGEFTDGSYREVTWDDEKWRGPVQFFSSR